MNPVHNISSLVGAVCVASRFACSLGTSLNGKITSLWISTDSALVITMSGFSLRKVWLQASYIIVKYLPVFSSLLMVATCGSTMFVAFASFLGPILLMTSLGNCCGILLQNPRH